MRENIFLTLGSPLIDIIATVEENFLTEHGLKANDAIKATNKHKQLFQDLENYQLTYQAGGCALNTARALQWILKTPRVSMVFGAVGNDNHSEILKWQLNNENVNFIFEEVQGEETGKCAVLLNGNNRSLCTDLGASEYFNIENLKNTKVWNVVQNAEYYYIPGFFLSVSFECLKEIAAYSFEEGKVFAFNLSAPFLSEMHKDKLEELLPYVNVLFGNECEARAYAKTLGFNNTNFYETILFLNNLPSKYKKNKRVTVITRGSKPVCVAQEDRVQEHTVNHIDDRRIKDTNAAGDAFVGGFMAEYMMEKPIDICIKTGIYVASRIIQNVGCSF